MAVFERTHRIPLIPRFALLEVRQTKGAGEALVTRCAKCRRRSKNAICGFCSQNERSRRGTREARKLYGPPRGMRGAVRLRRAQALLASGVRPVPASLAGGRVMPRSFRVVVRPRFVALVVAIWLAWRASHLLAQLGVVAMVSGVDALAHAVTESWRAWLSDGGKCCCDRCVRDAKERP